MSSEARQRVLGYYAALRDGPAGYCFALTPETVVEAGFTFETLPRPPHVEGITFDEDTGNIIVVRH